jgi:hypothetical protein
MRQEFPDLRRHCYRANRLRSASYAAFTTGLRAGAPGSGSSRYR